VPRVRQIRQHLHGAVVGPGRRVGIAGGNEHLRDSRAVQPAGDLHEFRWTRDHARSEVRHDIETLHCKLLGDGERRFKALRR
jgi:hypothetical protein